LISQKRQKWQEKNSYLVIFKVIICLALLAKGMLTVEKIPD